ncbi:hypothetical protein KZX45_12105 [Georgenia sp. EYE_87]|uniref:hypothetical protein n=1 Tax=Georgenia sp. EYE_87 TaxID=2853448 RepID=UPI002006CEDD|nr:hypothetical protein [Georgenia sp. EYE_87]MCK6211286.1 hypothetical protein [Georgenia sp. EYE_87]
MSTVEESAPDLRLAGPLGWTVVLSYVACNVFLVATTSPDRGSLLPHVVGLVIFAAAAAAAALLPGRRLTRAVTAALAVVPGLLALLVSWDLPTDRFPGYSAWHLGAGSFVLFFLAARGHLVSAWCGMAGLVAVTLAWFGTTGQDWRGLPDLLLTHLSFLVVGTTAGVVLHRAARQISAVAARARSRRAAHAARLAEAAERHRRLAWLEQNVRPALERLAEGHLPGQEERARLAVLEAEVRDRLRGGALDVPGVVAAVRAARLRGVAVEVMDDGGLSDVPDPAAVLAPIPGLLDGVAAGRVVIRILPPRRAAVASVVVETAEGTRRSTIGPDGAVDSPDAPSPGPSSSGPATSDAPSSGPPPSRDVGEHHVLARQRQPQPAVGRDDLDEAKPER